MRHSDWICYKKQTKIVIKIRRKLYQLRKILKPILTWRYFIEETIRKKQGNDIALIHFEFDEKFNQNDSIKNTNFKTFWYLCKIACI